MVGFGSSLRLARRLGWENGYLDYETLKLLLSQIEAVYEEGEDQVRGLPSRRGRRRRFRRGDDHDARDPHSRRPPRRDEDRFYYFYQYNDQGESAARRQQEEDDPFASSDSGSTGRPRRAKKGRGRKRGGGGRNGGRSSGHHRDDDVRETPSPSRGRGAGAIQSPAAARRDYRQDIFLESDSDLEYAESEEWDLLDRRAGGGRAAGSCAAGSARRRQRRSGSVGVGATSGDDNDDDDEYFVESSDAGEWNDPTMVDVSSGQQLLPSRLLTDEQQHGFYLEVAGSGEGNGGGGEDQQSYYLESSSLLGRGTTTSPGGGYESTTATARSNSLYSSSYVAAGESSLSLTPPRHRHQHPPGGGGYYYPPSDDAAAIPLAPPQLLHSSNVASPGMKRVPSADSSGGTGNRRIQPGTTLSPLTHPVAESSSQATKRSALPPHPRSAATRRSSAKGAEGRCGGRCGEWAGSGCCRRHRRRRQRRLARERERERERKVPRYLRVAHARARDIAERFLGKLRAETEKVLLFGQSRLGELADTIGSLRFPTDESMSSAIVSGEYGGVHQHQRHHHQLHQVQGRRTSFEYPLADGGMHPSSSSSDDEGFGGRDQNDGVSWSDSSDSDAARKPRTVSTQHRAAEDDASRGGVSSLGAASAANPQHRNAVLSAARRQIARYAEIRRSRPTFQRNDHILGEDLLFLSAIEEADGFTAVGVELMHVLRYICINLIAVRKICKRHDRLLMNRMLGGYYHRLKGDTLHLRDARTLGGLVAQASGDIYEAHPAVIAQMRHYKLEGVYDKKIQKLANSRTVQVISSCLALALSEYEVARTRAKSLIKLNSANSFRPSSKRSAKTAQGLFSDDSVLQPVLESDEEGGDGPPSTASTMSLTRLRFTVTSIFSLREAARFKLDHFDIYLSRSFAAFSGNSVVGEGLDGCSRQTLDFLLAYNPDAALLLDCSILFAGLKDGSWLRFSMRDIMIATLATGTFPETLPSSATVTTYMALKEKVVSRSLSIVPERKNGASMQVFIGAFGFPGAKSDRPSSLAGLDTPEAVLVLNRISGLLYGMNYYVGHATTNLFVRSAGAAPAHTSTIIGSPNLAACIMTLIHCWVLGTTTGSSQPERRDIARFRALFVISSLFGVVGNSVHASAALKESMSLAVLGRFLVGFSCTDMLQRRVVGWCSPSHFVFETGRLVRFRIMGVAIGLIVGAATEQVSIALSVREIQTTSWLMMALWLAHALRMFVQFRMTHVDVADALKTRGSRSDSSDQGNAALASHDSGGEDSDSSDDVGTPSRLLFRKTPYSPSENTLTLCYGKETQSSKDQAVVSVEVAETNVVSLPAALNQRKKPSSVARQWKVFTGRMKKLLMYRLCIPISFMMHLFVAFSLEAIFTSTPIITSRYFGWSGAHASMMLGAFAAFILPINITCEWIARRYEERIVVKRSLQVAALGLLIMVNWYSLFSLSVRIPRLFADEEGKGPQVYDWSLGVYQFVAGATVAFVGFASTEGANLSLLSKVSPPHLNGVFVNVGAITTFLAHFGRLGADTHILLVDLSRKLISTDLVNSIAIPLLLCSFLFLYMVRKNYFFLL